MDSTQISSDGQESPHLNQLTQLIAKTGIQIVIKEEKFKNISGWKWGKFKNSQLKIKFTGSYKKKSVLRNF